jgi:MFS family permease
VLALAIGVVLLFGFLVVERRSAAPMMPLELFRSLTFSGINIVTLLLYGALGGVMFFLPFLLIQVHGYSATEAGAVFLPFTILLALLSRRGGQMGDRLGARLPLIAGPLIVGLGFLLSSMPGSDGAYWRTFLLPMVVMGLGMAVTVAPLTTTVLNSVPSHETGVASGINNAVAQVAGLLLIAVLSTVGLTTLNRSLDSRLTATRPSPEVRNLVDHARQGFVMPPMPAGASEQTRQAARPIIAQSFTDSIRLLLLIGAGLSVASAVTASFTIRPNKR